MSVVQLHEELLTKSATALDIRPDIYEDAILKYEDIGAWLADDDSPIQAYSPEIYPQGSFRLGTAVRPIVEKDEHDIDLVCELDISKERISQKILKELVGDRLRKRDDLASKLSSMRRCWRLSYGEESDMPRFHMDVLPSIPNPERQPTGILLSDTRLVRWQTSNPKAYSDWFYERMKVMFDDQRRRMAKSLEASVDEVPVWRVKTPLQIAIQILKRHRDVHFQQDIDNRPISMIITTLGAQAYSNQSNVADTIWEILNAVPGQIEYRNGKWWIANPVDPDENFADKWNEYPQRREAFMYWLAKANSDFRLIRHTESIEKAVSLMSSAIGGVVTVKAAADMGITIPATSIIPFLPEPQVPDIGNTDHLRGPKWKMRLQYMAAIVGTVCHPHTSRKLWSLTNQPVPKHVKLKFEVNTTTPPPYTVEWQVVNTGQEAVANHALRGDYYPSDMPEVSIRVETTSYRGTHWVEAFIIKDNECVARSGPKMVRIR